MYIIGCYVTYLALTLAVTIWVARTLHSNGRVFLVDAFHGNTDLADSVNHLLVVGFYLINVGYVTYTSPTGQNLANLPAASELAGEKARISLLSPRLKH